jgi:hypothetical protein
MALNLIRNSKLLFTTNVNAATGVINDTLLTTAVTEIKATGVITVSSIGTLAVGKMISITGTASGTGSISGYAAGNNYFITAVSGNDITLSAVYAGTVVTTTAGTPTGLSVSLAVNRTLTTKALTVETTTGDFSIASTDVGLLQAGDVVILLGAASGTGSIASYAATGVAYYVTESHVGINPDSTVTDKVVNNYFKLSTTSGGGAVTSVAGPLTVATSITVYNRFTASNSQEIQVLDGFSFSQNTNNEQVTISEAGTTPKRGQRSFNTSLAPVDFSFSTYIRPTKPSNVTCEESVLWNALMGVEKVNTKSTAGSLTVPWSGGTSITYTYSNTNGTITVESASAFTKVPTVGLQYLINGVTSTNPDDVDLVNGPATVTSVTNAGSPYRIVFTMGNQTNTINTTTPAGTTGALTWTGITFYRSAWGESAVSSILAGHASNVNQLQRFGMLVVVDNVTYAIDNCALNEATIDFGLDGIATVQWTGQATALRQLTNSISLNSGTVSGGLSGNYNQKYTTAKYITNKLSTCRLKVAKKLVNASGNTVADIGTAYFLPITGGSVTISNNISYITPAILGVVNSPVAYYTATRSVTGTLNAYLNTGTLVGATVGGLTVTEGTGELLADLTAVADVETEPLFYIELALGGPTAATRVELQMPSVSIGIPTINVEQVVSTAINFTAAASTGAYASRTYDLDKTNELTLRYFTA